MPCVHLAEFAPKASTNKSQPYLLPNAETYIHYGFYLFIVATRYTLLQSKSRSNVTLQWYICHVTTMIKKPVFMVNSRKLNFIHKRHTSLAPNYRSTSPFPEILFNVNPYFYQIHQILALIWLIFPFGCSSTLVNPSSLLSNLWYAISASSIDNSCETTKLGLALPATIMSLRYRLQALTLHCPVARDKPYMECQDFGLTKKKKYIPFQTAFQS